MYKLFSVCFIIILFLSSCTQKKREYYPDGRLSYECAYLHGKKNGTEKRWYPDGKPQSEFYYQKDILQGAAKRWYPNGNLQREDCFKNNHLNGTSSLWDEDGNKTTEMTYIDDTLHGVYIEYHDNGQLKITGSYYKGLFHDEWVYYNRVGIKVGQARFNKGCGTLMGYNETNQLIREVNYKDNKKNGEEKHFDDEGKLQEVITYENDRIIEIKKIK